jgi:hypothetical protein
LLILPAQRIGKKRNNHSAFSACPACPVAPEDGTGACPVKFMSMRSEANFTGVGPEDRTGTPAVPSFYFFQSTIVNHKSSIPMRPQLLYLFS